MIVKYESLPGLMGVIGTVFRISPVLCINGCLPKDKQPIISAKQQQVISRNMTSGTKTSERVKCVENDCEKDYASKSGMKDHVKKAHQSLVQVVQDVVNFLTPQSQKVSEIVVLASPKELFPVADMEEDEAAIEEAGEDVDIYLATKRAEEIEAVKVPIVPDGNWLSNTLPSGDLSTMLMQVNTKTTTKEAPEKVTQNQLSCVQCLIGKEENKKQNLLNKANNKANRDLRKELANKMNELKECRELLAQRTKEVVDLKSRLETRPTKNYSSSNNDSDIIEEVVTAAGDFQTCECCDMKLKGMTKLIKHQQSAHFTCQMCSGSKWVGLSLEHLKIHHQHTHGVKSSGIISCTVCKLKFPDGMSLNVHNFKKHNFKCSKCSELFSDKKILAAHMKNTYVHAQEVHHKCIVCEHKATSEVDLTRHYENEYISSDAKVCCSVCNINFTNVKSLDIHNKKKHSFRCTKCNDTFTEKNLLD